MEFSFRLTGKGWAEARIADDFSEVVLRVSLFSDVLGDLIFAVKALMDGASTAECSWQAEPPEHLWFFDYQHGQVTVTIVAFDDEGVGLAEPEGTEVFKTTCGITDLATTIAREVDRVLIDYTMDDYRHNVSIRPFPIEVLQSVQAQLRVR